MQPLLHRDTILLKQLTIEIFKGSNDVSGEDDLTVQVYDSAIIEFDDFKKLIYSYSKTTGISNVTQNILVSNRYVIKDSIARHSNYYFRITNNDYLSAE